MVIVGEKPAQTWSPIQTHRLFLVDGSSDNSASQKSKNNVEVPKKHLTSEMNVSK